MTMSIFQVDAFTSEAFCGNPAGVVILTKKMPDQWIQGVALEMNLSETAFILKEKDSFSLRWFTPKVEVDLCGHATLASAHVLFEKSYLEHNETVNFDTLSGRLCASVSDGWITLDFPCLSLEQIPVSEKISQALGFSPNSVYKTDVNILIEMSDPQSVKGFTPNFSKLAELPYQGLIITARGDDGRYDFVSRYFAPRAGIDEDPVTGSAHCSLAPYWVPRLNKNKFDAYQVSKRGGNIKVELVNDRVLLTGQAVTIFSGSLEI